MKAVRIMVREDYQEMANELKEDYQEKYYEIQLKNYEKELKNKLRQEKRKVKRFDFSGMKTSNLVLFSSIVMIVLFTAACLFIQYKTGSEPSSTLITLWFTFWTVEIASLAGIKITKVIKERKDNGENIASPIEHENETFELCE